MTRLRAALLWIAIPAALAVPPIRAAGQDNFEIHAYGSETVAPGPAMFELHSNSAIRGTTRTEDGTSPTQDAAHATLELTHGSTPSFETGVDIFQPDQGWEWVGRHVCSRIRVPEDWHWAVGLSPSVEIGYQSREHSTDTWTMEIRPIIDEHIGPWYFAFNPVLDQSLTGEGPRAGIEFSPNAELGFDLTKVVSAIRHQQHLLFAVVDRSVDPRWDMNPGVGVGLAPDSDGLILKMILAAASEPELHIDRLARFRRAGGLAERLTSTVHAHHVHASLEGTLVKPTSTVVRAGR